MTELLDHRSGVVDLRRLIETARAQIEAGKGYEAGVLYRIILRETTPPTTGLARIGHGEACLWYARDALAKQRFGTAADWYREAIAADPLAADYRAELAVRALLPMGLLRDARIEAERATRIDPGSAPAWRALAGIEHELGNVEVCIAGYDKQLELLPDDPGAMLDRATVAMDVADYETVRRLCAAVISSDRAADAWHCLAMVEAREGRHDRAVELYDKAIALGCADGALVRWHKSISLSSIGRYREGWAENEQRGKQKTNAALGMPMRRFSLPMWQGEPPPARIHVHEEMGFGDTIALARYVGILAKRGYDVRLEVRDSLVDLMKRSFPTVTIVPKAVDYPAALGIPVFDYHVPMLSLPAIFGTDIDTVPWDGPYLEAQPLLAAEYRERVPKGAIGLCWSSGIRDGIWIGEYGRRKSLSIAEVGPLLRTDLPFVSLQVGPERAQIARRNSSDLLPSSPTWADTAALIDCLDLVITADTAVAHLAGAMGKRVWVMMHTEGSWHWMTDRVDSPWYPSATLYRQERPHDWAPVIERIARDLRKAP